VRMTEIVCFMGDVCYPTLYGLVLLVTVGCSTTRQLAEPSGNMGDPKTYASVLASRTLTLPVAYDPPDSDFMSPVMETDFLGDPKSVGVFPAGKIIAREFGRVVRANFAEHTENSPPIGRFAVKIDRVSVKKVDGDVLAASIEVTVKLVNASRTETVYAKSFSASSSEAWKDVNTVPGAFYVALRTIITCFLDDWFKNNCLATFQKWEGMASPGIVPPGLRSLDFTQQGDVYCGNCVVSCNGYEGFKAKGWSDVQIEQACRKKLGIEPERVRIVYDKEDFDQNAKEWRFEFRTFARTKTVLTFNKATGHGYATGDLGLMGMSADAALEELRRFVHKEMDARAGVVSSTRTNGEALVRFDDVTTDDVFNLITIGFRLVK